MGSSVSRQPALASSSTSSSSSALSSFSPSSSSSVPPRWNYDVFLSFRGEDTRKNFVDHLYTSLKQKGIHTFRDDEKLERGKEISPELLRAIEQSRFSIIVFSENYATSKWCLDELVKIMDCTKETGHIPHPLFYNVDPSNVRKQTGSFAKALANHEKDLKITYSTNKRKRGLMEDEDRVQRWKAALSEAANRSGWDSRERHQSELIQEIVEDIFNKLNRTFLHVDDNLVGIDFHMKEMDSCLRTLPNDVKFVGIYGLGGIGKTTIAKALYNKISYQFEGCSYLADVRESSKKHGLVPLQKQLLCDILRITDLDISNVDRGSYLIKNRLRFKRVLVILDDVDHLDQLEKLVGKHDWFGSGSRIIITTRDEHLLDAHGTDERYKVGVLDPEKSLELFCWKAFKQNHPEEDFKELSNNVVYYAKGLPLALKVLGSFLCGRSKPAWNSEVEKLRTIPNSEIIEVLKISYDGLDQWTEREIFLDIAFFFKGQDKKHVTKILHSFGFYPDIGIDVLIERSLINISEDNKIMMHDLVQDMGRSIVCQESLKDCGKRSRLWHHEDIRHVLMKNARAKAVEVIMLDLPRPYESEYHVSRPKEVRLAASAEAIAKMYKLRLLKIHNVDLPQGLSNLSDELRILDWYGYPLEHLPSSFLADKLVELNMRNSRIVQLWNRTKVVQNLTSINLSESRCLTEFLDFTGAPNLEELNLDHCSNLLELHPSLGLHKRLKCLKLNFCDNLKSLPCMIEMESLESLYLSGCRKFDKFPEILGDMGRLTLIQLEQTAIEEVPDSFIENLTGLEKLCMNDCRNLVSLRSSICKLKTLKSLVLRGCSKLKKIPDNLEDLESLEILNISETALGQVPPSIVLLKKLRSLDLGNSMGLQLPSSFRNLCSLNNLSLRNCNLLDGSIPSDLSYLSSLDTLDLSGNDFVSLPASIFSQLSQLTALYLVDCKWLQALPKLPSSLDTLKASGCTSLERLSNPSTIFKSNYPCFFEFINCFKLVEDQYKLTDDGAQHIQQIQALFGNSEHFYIYLPGNVIPGWFTHQELGSSIGIQLPPNWYNKKLQGIAFCVVVAGETVDSQDLESLYFDLKSEADDGGEVIFSNQVPFDYRKTMSEHVVLAYISCARFNSGQFYKSAERLNGYTQMEASSFIMGVVDVSLWEVKKCGICLVYDSNDHSLT